MLGQKYVLDRIIGKGGMGEVWAGTNERTGKRIALKMIRRSFASNSDAAELFRREALAASRVNHPNVVTVFDVIDHEGMTCIVMELLDGEPLNEYLAREAPLSPEKAAALLLPAMRGVAAANAQGVIHRDLKPHNIFLCVGADGRMVTTKVLDFGSSATVESSPSSSSATVQIATVGTPAYMAPEHIAGVPNIDERADVYGFGVVFFEALAGQHPFPGAPGLTLLTSIMSGPPLPLISLRSDLPPEVIQIIERAMAKEPSERFPNLDSFIRVVEEHLMPSSSLPQNMTPLAGVPVVQLCEPSASVVNVAAQVVRRADAASLYETRALYNLSSVSRTSPGGSLLLAGGTVKRDEGCVPDPVGGLEGEGASEVPGSIDQLPTLGRSIRRLIRKPRVVHTAFGAVLAAVIWMAFPMPRTAQDTSAAGGAPSTTVPASPAEDVKTAKPAPEPSRCGPARSDDVPHPDQDIHSAGEMGQPSTTIMRPAAPQAKPASFIRHVPVTGTGPAKAPVRAVHEADATTTSATLPSVAAASTTDKTLSQPPVEAAEPACSALPLLPSELPPPRAGSLSTDDF